ncbi:ACETYL-COA-BENZYLALCOHOL ACETYLTRANSFERASE-LIKE [Salix koriyanagi]|uniref:ACETYL-COA-BENZYLALCOHOL ACETYLTRANSFERASE-LIKE n=1 Tax=Salix koriyanagi TaxID=2511006 RepID=A0A9Q0SUX6_9ROSI|nr:ACETYL-COA-BENZYLALCOHOL ACETYLTRANSFERASE-LIKE [Salix koriyanagi]
MRVAIVSRKFITPSSSTPPHLRSCKISALDQLIPPVYGGLTCFYPADGNIQGAKHSERRKQLEESLSKILTLYYPAAGRYILNGELQPEELNQLLPYPVASPTTPLVAVQISTFECGGMAVGLRFSHKIFDIAALTSFFNGWATTCRAGIDEVPGRSFASAIPLSDERDSTNSEPNSAWIPEAICLNPWSGNEKEISIANTTKLLRKHAEACDGAIRARREQNGLRDLVITVRKAIRDAVMDCRDATSCDELFARAAESFRGWNEEAGKGEIDLYTFSSWCGFPVYEVDFGWGKPAWVSSPHKPVPVVNLLDTKDGGVAVWMTAEEMDMILFQRDPEIVDLTTTSQLKNHV